MKTAVITCSNRSARGERVDDSGRLLATGLEDLGHEVTSRQIVADDVEAIRAAVRDALAGGADVVLTTGGTGMSPTDVTPEAVGPLLERSVPGIAEALRLVDRDRVPTSVLSRGLAGVIGTSLVVTLPGSPGGVRDGLAVLAPLLDHAVDQLRGGDHPAGGGQHARHDGGPDDGASGPGVAHSAVTVQPLDAARLESLVDHPAAGGVVVFRGVVRDHDHGRPVTELEYVAHPSAGQVLADVVASFATEPEVIEVAAEHRVGVLGVGDLALVAAVSSAHRGAAFDTCARLVDEIKRRLPVWKRQVFDDGSDEWVNCP